MFKGTPELIAQRREEIICACEKLYQSINEITYNCLIRLLGQ